MTTKFDFNREPYFDDYDESKNFYQILFRPGRAVQTRELNQIQSMIQKQIERFGNHIFKEGSIVLGGQLDFDNNVDSIQLNSVNIPQFDEINFQNFVGTFVEGQLSNLKAYVIAQKFDAELGVQILMVRYVNSNELDEKVFRAEENIIFGDTGLLIPTIEESPTSKGSVLKIEEGVVFVNGYFVQFPSQNIVISPFLTTPSIAVGFIANDPAVVTSNQDSSLLDNAQGTFNFVAPGADRFLLSLTLKLAPLNEIIDDETFTLIANIKNGDLIRDRERPKYAEIYGEIAKRTSDESGDYYVRGLTVRTREALDTGINEGLDEAGSSEELSVDVEPGLAYVKGFEVNNLITRHVLIDKGIDFRAVNNALINARTGGFFVINEIVGSASVDEGIVVELYDQTEQRVTNQTNVTASIDGGNVQIGTARIKTVLYDSGSLGTAQGSLQLYLFDIVMEPGKVISDINSVYVSDVFFADVSGSFSNTIENTLIYPIGTTDTRKIRKQTDENQTDTNFSFYATINDAIITQNTNTISVSSPVPLGYGIGVLGVNERRTIFVSTNSPVAGNNNFPSGQHLDLGNSSVVVTVTGTNTFTINLGNTFSSVTTNTLVTVTYKARRAEIFETPKQLISNVFVKINYAASGAPESLTAPINLGLADVFRLKEVRRKAGADFANANDGEDVTSSFRLENGQRDNFYDHAKLIPLSNIINSDDRLLIKVDVFRVVSHSYFSVDSYPIDNTEVTNSTIFTFEIPKYTSTSGTVFNLRDCLDYRPYKDPTASYSITDAGASINPITTNSFIGNVETNKLLIPVSSSPIQIDYSFFLARRDIITLDQNGIFNAIRGVPSTSPITPSVSENVMPIVNVFIPPFPSISQSLARILNLKDGFVTTERVSNKRFTMRDIGVLKSRIENLEYYNLLNLLEKETESLLVLDQDGNDRFKNGFFVDGFLDHSLGATSNPDYNIALDPDEQLIRPTFELDSFKYELLPGGELEKTGNLLHLPIVSEETLIDQPFATTRRNVEQSVYRFFGELRLLPDNDSWVDTRVIDRQIQFGNDLPDEKTIETSWGSWERHIVGYDAFAGSRKIGRFNSYAEALNSVQKTGSAGKIETIFSNQRSGIEVTTNVDRDTQNIGEFITDVSIIPYIRPQAIEFFVKSVKPNTRHFIFFDGEPVTKFCRQYVDPNNPDVFIPLPGGANAEPIIRSNEFGELRGVLFLPEDGKRFRVGAKNFTVVDSPNFSSENVTSIAKEFFLATGLNVQKQNTILSTKFVTSDQELVFQARTERTVNAVSAPIVRSSSSDDGGSDFSDTVFGSFFGSRSGVSDTGPITPNFDALCSIAYTFKPEVPVNEEGTFLTSVDLFFQEFDPDLGFVVQIRELNSAGNITKNVLPYSKTFVSRKVLDSDGNRVDNPILNVSEDGSVATNIKFESPVFVYNDTDYAIVISAEQINPNTYLWISQLGETDLITQQTVNSRALTGTLFTTNNGVNWDSVPQADLKIKLYRANFETQNSLVSNIKNSGYEFFALTNVQSIFNRFGENIRSSERLTVSLSSGTVSIGDTVTGQTSNITSTVVSVESSNVFTTGFGYEENETVIFESGGNTVAEGQITDIRFGLGKLSSYSIPTEKMKLSDTNGRFFEGAIIQGQISELEAEIQTLESFEYNSSLIKPDFLNFNNTRILFAKRGRRSSNNSLIPYQEGSEDATTSFTEELNILSRSTERALFGASAGSSDVIVNMVSNSEFLSPMVDMSRANAVYIYNLINSDVSGEEAPSGGNLIAKYISKTITLADGQDAEDLLVFLSAYRPPSLVAEQNDIRVFMKVRNGEDPEAFADKPYFEMIKSSEDFSSLDNDRDFIELRFTPPEELLNNGIITYDANVDGTPVTLSTYKQYSIKIGLVGGNSSIVPKVAELRAVALQK